ncbi:MAG TPA: hypothetical protein VK699_04160 [Terriglobales bacterium]|jgi:hypothetical protein|nr:hypothetical protein [Terriglobales bacterium]
MSVEKPAIWTKKGNKVEYVSAKWGDDVPLRSDGAEVLYHEYGVQLRRTTDGRYVLNVLCGRVGQYGVEIELTPEEIDSYRKRGDVFIHSLGENVYGDPNRFQSRIIRSC